MDFKNIRFPEPASNNQSGASLSNRYDPREKVPESVNTKPSAGHTAMPLPFQVDPLIAGLRFFGIGFIAFLDLGR